MKLKYQQGGGLIYTPFIPGSLQSTATSGGNDNSGSDEPKIDALDKEILALMKGADLLPSDVQEIYNALISFQRSTQHLSDYGGGTSAYRTVMPKMLRIMNMIDVAKHNKDYWNGKMTEMRQHDAGSEVALDSYGRMWVQDLESKELKRIAPTDFDREKYNPVSNSMLMYMRERDLGFGDSIIDDTGMSLTGMGDVREEMDNIISKFGTIKSDDLQVQKFSDIAKDLQGMGVYKITNKYSKGDLHDFTGLLYNRLSRNAQHLIDANCAISGNDLHDYILGIIRSETSLESSQDYEANLTKAVGLGGAGGSGSDSDEKLNDHDTYAERLASGAGVVAHWDYIMPGNSGSKLWGYVQNYGTPMSNDKSMGTMSMEKFMQNFDASGDIEWSKATFGGYNITSVDLPKIMFKGGSTIKRMYLPVKPDGTVDFTAQQEMATLQNWIDENGILNETLIQERVSEIDNAYWDPEEKVIKFHNSKPFFILDVLTSSDKVRFNSDSPYVYNMDKGPADIRRDWLDTYEDVLENGYPGATKNKDYDFGKTRGRHLYEGLLFLPIVNDTIAATIYHNQNVSKNRYVDVRDQAELKEKKQNLRGNYAE